jgi:hypothetical protein
VALVRTDVSEDHIASIIGVKRISVLEITLAVTSNYNSSQGTSNSSQRASVASYC